MGVLNTTNLSGLTYRIGANAIIYRSDKKILLVQKQHYKSDEWDLPGGGVDEGESLTEGLLRELEEELYTDQFVVVKQSKTTNKYDWSEDQILKNIHQQNEKRHFRGQIKYLFLVEFTGDEDNVRPQEEEIRCVKWVAIDDLQSHLIFPNQFHSVSKALSEFGWL